LERKEITQAEGEELRLFFAGLGGVDPFQWQPWGQPAALKWVSTSTLRIQPSGFEVVDCRIDIKQVFDLD